MNINIINSKINNLVNLINKINMNRKENKIIVKNNNNNSMIVKIIIKSTLRANNINKENIAKIIKTSIN
jgi:hypothetical protein